MKKKFFLILLALASALCLVFGVTACVNVDPSAVNSTYYRYEGGQLDTSEWYELKDRTWKDFSGNQGTYKFSGNKILFYGKDQLGKNIHWATGTVKDGILTISSIGVTHTYRRV